MTRLWRSVLARRSIRRNSSLRRFFIDPFSSSAAELYGFIHLAARDCLAFAYRCHDDWMGKEAGPIARSIARELHDYACPSLLPITSQPISAAVLPLCNLLFF